MPYLAEIVADAAQGGEVTRGHIEARLADRLGAEFGTTMEAVQHIDDITNALRRAVEDI